MSSRDDRQQGPRFLQLLMVLGLAILIARLVALELTDGDREVGTPE